jgi:hypothetical protein
MAPPIRKKINSLSVLGRMYKHYLTHSTAVSAGVEAVFSEIHFNIPHGTASRCPSSRSPLLATTRSRYLAAVYRCGWGGWCSKHRLF